MHHHFVFRFLLVVCCVAITPLGLSSDAEEISESLVREFTDKVLEKNEIRGLSVGYIQHDQWGTHHFGAANRNGTKPNNLTVYELGSLSKVFMSLLVADAVVRGRIDLDDPVRVRNRAAIELPAFQGEKITWLDLCTHRSGQQNGNTQRARRIRK